MIREKEVLRFLELLAIRSVVILDDYSTITSNKLESIFKRYNESFFSILDEIDFFNSIYREAQVFRDRNSNLLMDDLPSNNYIETANTNLKAILSRTLVPLIDNINAYSEHKDLLFKVIKEAYNLGGQLSMYQVLLQNRLVNNLLRKQEFSTAELTDYIEIEDMLGNEFANIDAVFFLKNPRILEQLKERANESKYLSNAEYETVRKTLLDEFYVKGENPIPIAKMLREKFTNLSVYRSQLIARTEVHVAQNSAIRQQGKEIGAESKQWMTVGDERVRDQHFTNEIGGPVRWELPFAGGPMEQDPGDCESPYMCRCVLQILASKSPTNFVWDGDEIIFL